MTKQEAIAKIAKDKDWVFGRGSVGHANLIDAAEEVWDAAIEAAARKALAEKVDADETRQESDYAYNNALEDAAEAIRELKKG